MYQLVNVITYEITDLASPSSVCGYFMGFNETLHIDSLRDSQNICPTNLNRRIMHRAVLLLVHSLTLIPGEGGLHLAKCNSASVTLATMMMMAGYK